MPNQPPVRLNEPYCLWLLLAALSQYKLLSSYSVGSPMLLPSVTLPTGSPRPVIQSSHIQAGMDGATKNNCPDDWQVHILPEDAAGVTWYHVNIKHAPGTLVIEEISILGMSLFCQSVLHRKLVLDRMFPLWVIFFFSK